MAIDATPGGIASDSYATLAEAEAYLGARLYADAWSSATEAQKEAALKWATSLVDTLDFPHPSKIATETQRLRWPRAHVYTPDGISVASNAIPRFLREAVIEFALALLEDNRAAESGLAQFEEITVGAIVIRKDRTSRRPLVPPAAWNLLAPYALMPGGSGRVNRA